MKLREAEYVGQAVGAPYAPQLGIASVEISTSTSSAAQRQRTRSQQRPDRTALSHGRLNFTCLTYSTTQGLFASPSILSIDLGVGSYLLIEFVAPQPQAFQDYLSIDLGVGSYLLIEFVAPRPKI